MKKIRIVIIALLLVIVTLFGFAGVARTIKVNRKTK